MFYQFLMGKLYVFNVGQFFFNLEYNKGENNIMVEMLSRYQIDICNSPDYDIDSSFKCIRNLKTYH